MKIKFKITLCGWPNWVFLKRIFLLWIKLFCSSWTPCCSHLYQKVPLHHVPRWLASFAPFRTLFKCYLFCPAHVKWHPSLFPYSVLLFLKHLSPPEKSFCFLPEIKFQLGRNFVHCRVPQSLQQCLPHGRCPVGFVRSFRQLQVYFQMTMFCFPSHPIRLEQQDFDHRVHALGLP